MNAVEIMEMLDELDGYGLVVTDPEHLADHLETLGFDVKPLRRLWAEQDRQVGA